MITLTFGALAVAGAIVLLIGLGIGRAVARRRETKLRRRELRRAARRERIGRAKQALLPWRRGAKPSDPQ